MQPDVYVVGGGPSLKDFDFTRLRERDTIVVNRAVKDVPDPTYFITMDNSFFFSMPDALDHCDNATKVFVADFETGLLEQDGDSIYDIRHNRPYALKGFDRVVISRQEAGMGIGWDDFRNGRNSGYCALQLAVVLGYTRIHLLGIDLNISSGTHYHNCYEGNPAKLKYMRNNVDNYLAFFRVGIMALQYRDIEVISHSKQCPLNNLIKYQGLDVI